MSTNPGEGVNNPEGFVDLTDPQNVRVIVVDGLSAAVNIPVSILPFWRNDAGIRSFGGAQIISMWEDGAAEGVSTPRVQAVNQQPISSTGSLTLTRPDENYFYKIRVRLRSVANDPNYKDYVFAFRVNTPLAVPLDLPTYDDADIPNIVYSAPNSFQWDNDPPASEIRLRGGDGAQLPAVSAVDFNPTATSWLLDVLSRKRTGVFVVDFMSGGGVEVTRRQTYSYRWDSNTNTYVFAKVRSKDYAAFNQYAGSDLAIAVANITQPNPDVDLVPATGVAVINDGSDDLWFSGMAYDSSADVVYGVELVVGGHELFTMDPLTGAATFIAAMTDTTLYSYGLTYDSVNERLVMVTGGASGSEFWEVNKLTGVCTLLYSPSFLSLRGLCYHAANARFYTVSSANDLYEIDLDGGSATNLGNLGAPIRDLAYNPNTNEVYGVQNTVGDLRRIDLVTPDAVSLGSHGMGSALGGLCYHSRLDRLLTCKQNTTSNNYAYMPFSTGGTATLTFSNSLYSTGEKFESLIVAGKKGMLEIEPALAVVGGTINIESVVDLTTKRLFHKYGADDQYVVLAGVTDANVIIRQIPLWDRATSLYAKGGQQLVPDVATSPTYLIQGYLVGWPFWYFVNLADFYDPSGMTTPPASLSDITLYDESGVAQANWAAASDMFGDMQALQMPLAGRTLPVLDVRSMLSSSDSAFELEGTVDDGVNPAYTVRCNFKLNVDGLPEFWKRPDLDAVEEMPTFQFTDFDTLEITTPGTWTASTQFEVIGDSGPALGLGTQSAATVDTYDVSSVVSRLSAYCLVQWRNASDELVSVRVPTAATRDQLVGSDDIQAVLNGNTIMFPVDGLDEVDTVGGVKTVHIVGDIGSTTIHDAQEGVVYRLGSLGKGSRIMSSAKLSYVDLHFTGVSGASQVRVFNTFYDYREQGQANSTLAISNRGGPSTFGVRSDAYNFSMPRMKVNFNTGEVDFEDDGSLMVFNTQKVMFTNCATQLQTTLSGQLVLGTPYSLGLSARGLVAGDLLIVSAMHYNGQTTTVGYRVGSSYSSPIKLTPLGTL